MGKKHLLRNFLFIIKKSKYQQQKMVLLRILLILAALSQTSRCSTMYENASHCGKATSACKFIYSMPEGLNQDWYSYDLVCEANKLTITANYTPPNTTCPLMNQRLVNVFIRSRDHLVKSIYYQNLASYLGFFPTPHKYLVFERLNGFYVDFIHSDNEINENRSHGMAEVVIDNSKLVFYDNNKPLASCEDFYNASISSPSTLFQLKNIGNNFGVYHCFFEKKLCPLIFKNSMINQLRIDGMVSSFYQKNVLKFSRDFDRTKHLKLPYPSIIHE